MTVDVSVAPRALDRAREVVVPAMREVVARLDDTSAAIASYHLGWTDADGAPTRGGGSGGGKAIRPALVTLSAQAAGASAAPQIAVPGAVAVELVHNFSLLHDDLMDGDTHRRHRPTVWALWGAASAILTGYAWLVLAQEVLLDSVSPHRGAAARLLAEATRQLVRGQVQDMAFERRDDVTVAECLDMVSGKTGALFSVSTAIGAVLAGAKPEVVAALTTFGAHLGVAFQLLDDLLGIWGDPVITGKPVYSDLRSGKKTLPVTYALTHGGPAGRELAAWLAVPDCSLPDRAVAERVVPDGQVADHTVACAVDAAALRRAADLVEAAGGRAWAVAEAHRRVAAACHALTVVPIPDEPREDLTAIARFIVARES
ncbi:MAG: polyprenyl synthetase family protein [Pseudonocardiales bacterium]